MTSFFDAMREEIEAEGGTVEKYIGDAVMAAFGVPAAHEDDPARAIRAAGRMLTRLHEVNGELDESTASPWRSGSDQHRRGDRGHRAQARRGHGHRRRGERGRTARAIGRARERPGVRAHGAGGPRLSLQGDRGPRAGRQGAAVVALQLVSPEPEGPERGVPGLRAPLVGREDELELLRSLYRRVAADSRPHLVTVYGDPGVGKSRLTAEFLEWSQTEPDPPLVVRGRCLPYGDGVTYWPLAEILKQQAEILDTDSAAGALEKVRGYASGALAEGLSPDPGRAAAALAYTVGLEDPAQDFAALAPRQVHHETHAAWRSLFSGLAQQRPIVVVIEDIHWADPALLDLLEELADRVVGPALFLCPSRPELTQRRPGWGGGRRNSTGVFLEPLTPEDARKLIGFLLTVEDLPESVRGRILERAEGNPFFLEEIIRHLIDERRIVRVGRRWKAADRIEDVVIPDTVQGVLAARIDLLGPAEKRTLQSAAVVGRVFWSGPVERLLNGEAAELDDLLARLEERELVAARVDSTIGGEREYSFKHVLTRDVAYGTLPRGERARAHGRVARWIESTTGERRAEFAELLAYHYLEAYRSARGDPQCPEQEREALRAAAFENLVAASRDARRRLALEKAVHLAEEAGSIAETRRRAFPRPRAARRRTLPAYNGEPAWAAYGRAIEIQPRETEEDRRRLARLCAKRADLPTRWPGSMSPCPRRTRSAR